MPRVTKLMLIKHFANCILEDILDKYKVNYAKSRQLGIFKIEDYAEIKLFLEYIVSLNTDDIKSELNRKDDGS